MKTPELKPCPFCGGNAVFVAYSCCSGAIVCIGDCGIRTDKYWDDPMTDPPGERKKWKEVVKEKWNRRVEG